MGVGLLDSLGELGGGNVSSGQTLQGGEFQQLLAAIQGPQASGLAGFLGGPQGALISQAAGPLLQAFGSLFFGDGGKGNRLKEAQGAFRDLLGSDIDEAGLQRGSQLFERSQLPTLNKLFQGAAGRVGLDSGIGQSAAIGQFGDILSQFNTQQFLQERQRVSQDRRLGAQGLASVINV